MNRIIRRFKVRRIMRLLNKFRRTDVAYVYLGNYYLTRDFYGTEIAENELLEKGYNKILDEITDELFNKLDGIA